MFNQIALISVVGKYRTGKSFLLNKILIEKVGAFKIGSTQKACTKGIWVYSKPKVITYNNNPMHIFFIDTEGLGAYDEDLNHDTKIFLVAILISSLFIFNSHGTIDESSINTLGFIINLSKYLKINYDDNSNNCNKNNNIDNNLLEEYFPDFLWLLRDFTLKLVDKEGNNISSSQYLETALNQETSKDKAQIRKSIKGYFTKRDCYSLIRPVEDERDLQNLENLDENMFRNEFIQQCNALRKRIFSNLTPKKINNKLLTGFNLISFLDNIVETINLGKIPVIENSWNYMISSENFNNVKKLSKEFNIKLKQYYLKEVVDNLELNVYNNKTFEQDLIFIKNKELYSENNEQEDNLIKIKNTNNNDDNEFTINNNLSNSNNINNNNKNSSNEEDSQTDYSKDISSLNINNGNNNSNYIKLSKINFNELYNNLLIFKNKLICDILENHVNKDNFIMHKNSSEFIEFKENFTKTCENEYKKFYELEIELFFIKYFNEKINEKIQCCFNFNNKLCVYNSNILNKTNNSYKNYYNFITDLENFVEDIDVNFPIFKNKYTVINNKIFFIIKKYYEYIISNEKASLESETYKLRNDLDNSLDKNVSLENEIKQINTENREKLLKLNNLIVELKSKNITLASNLEKENELKKNLTITYDDKLNELLKNKDKLDLYYKNIVEKYEIEIKEKDNNLLLSNLSNEKRCVLNEQKIDLITKELNDLKDRYNVLNKEKEDLIFQKDDLEFTLGLLKSTNIELEENKKKLTDNINTLKKEIEAVNSYVNNTNKQNNVALKNKYNNNINKNVNNLNCLTSINFNKSFATVNSNNEISKLIKNNEYLKNQLENTKKIYDEIIRNLRANLQEKNNEYLKEINNKNIIDSNQSLTNSLKNYELRCSKLEEKLKNYLSFKFIVKSASTFQCKECFKSFSLEIFSKHIINCKKTILKLEQNIVDIAYEEKKIQATVEKYFILSSNGFMINFKILVKHMLQNWIINKDLESIINLNKDFECNYNKKVDFDFDYLINNNLTLDCIEDLKKNNHNFNLDQTNIINILNVYFKCISANNILNKSKEFKTFTEYYSNYDELNTSIDKENVLNYEILNNIESTLSMTMNYKHSLNSISYNNSKKQLNLSNNMLIDEKKYSAKLNENTKDKDNSNNKYIYNTQNKFKQEKNSNEIKLNNTFYKNNLMFSSSKGINSNNVNCLSIDKLEKLDIPDYNNNTNKHNYSFSAHKSKNSNNYNTSVTADKSTLIPKNKYKKKLVEDTSVKDTFTVKKYVKKSASLNKNNNC